MYRLEHVGNAEIQDRMGKLKATDEIDKRCTKNLLQKKKNSQSNNKLEIKRQHN